MSLKTDITKASLAFLLFLLLAGPSMLCIGIAIVIQPSNRLSQIDQYNTASRNYAVSKSYANDWSYLNSNINGVQATNAARPITINGDLKDVERFAAPVVVSAELPLKDGKGDFNTYIGVNLNQVDAFSVYRVAATSSRPAIAFCDKPHCPVAEMQATCQAEYGADATFSGPLQGCDQGACGECRHNVFLKEVCLVVRQKHDGNFERDPTMGSCFYPFTEDTRLYETTPGNFAPSTFTVTIRRSDDPFIALQKITRGTNNFGPNKSSEYSHGWGLIGSGIGLTVILAIISFIIYGTTAKAVSEAATKKKAASESESSSPSSNEPTA